MNVYLFPAFLMSGIYESLINDLPVFKQVQDWHPSGPVSPRWYPPLQDIIHNKVPTHSFFSFGFGFDAFVLTAIQNLLARK
jgi:hypothetical protein